MVWQSLKTLLRDQLGIPAPAVLLVAGAVLHLSLNLLLRKPLASPLGLMAPFAAGVALESYEIFERYRADGLFAPGNDPLIVILGRHSLDLLALLAIPLIIVAWGYSSAR